MKKCSICSLEFEPKAHNGIMCSAQCVKKYRNEKQKIYSKKTRIFPERHNQCVICGISFIIPKHTQAICCSEKCSKERTKMRHKSYKNDPNYIEKSKIYNKNHRDSDKRKKWINENKERLYKNNSEYCKKRRKYDVAFRIAAVLRTSLNRMARDRGTKRLKDFISYSSEDLKVHIEKQFSDGMSWENYGRLGWHIDHKKPITAFQFFDENGNMLMDQVRECMSLENLQPLWYADNIRKGGAKRYRENKS